MSSLLLVAGLFITLFMVRLFVFTPMTVGGDSMKAPYNKGAYIVVSKLKFPRKNDIIVFKNNYLNSHSKSDMRLIGKIVAEPGDYIEYRSEQFYRNGHVEYLPFKMNQNFKLHIPRKRLNILLNNQNLVAYRSAIKEEQQDYAKIQGGQLFLNGRKMSRYTFENDYYWVLSDKEMSGPDSRHIGIISGSDIVGVVILP